ncbi:hypothetical protein LUQ84_3526 [Hamiltosporidium tvaerminnensis]|nr:hypothetical protein LUQ84_3526 [Hamiltosporidium tvaerminnensis]
MQGFLISYNRGKEGMAIKEIKTILNSLDCNTDNKETYDIDTLLNKKIEIPKDSITNNKETYDIDTLLNKNIEIPKDCNTNNKETYDIDTLLNKNIEIPKDCNTNNRESTNIDTLLNKNIETIKKSNFIPLNKPKLKTLSIIKNTSQISSLDLFKSIKKKKIKTKYIQRMIPLSFITLKADIQTHIKSYCDIINKDGGTYKILYKSRCSNKEIKEKVFEIIIFYVTNTVNLDNPDNYILVEVMCNILGIGIFKSCDFNINALHIETN